MKAHFIIERTFTDTIDLELNDIDIALSDSCDRFETIRKLAREKFSESATDSRDFSDSEFGELTDFTLIPTCSRCGEELDEEDIYPCFLEGEMLCPECYNRRKGFNDRKEALDEAGIDLEEIANLLLRKMYSYNTYLTNTITANYLRTEVETIQTMLKLMNVTLEIGAHTPLYTSFILNGKTYTL